VPDAGTPDASAQLATRGGTIAISEVSVAGHEELGSGAAVSISYTVRPEAVPPVFDNRDGIGQGCAVWVYDLAAGELPPAFEDEGTVTVSGTESAIAPCNLASPSIGYIGPAGGGAVAAGDSVLPNPPGPLAGTAVVTIAAGAFTQANVGMFLQVSGFTTATNNGAFPIVGAGAPFAANQALVGNPFAAAETATGAGMFAIISGAGPTPSSVNFLDDGTADVTVDKEASAEVEAFTSVGNAAGEGVALSQATAGNMTDMPLDGAFSLGCGTTCGEAPSPVLVTAVAGRTTTGSVAGLPDYVMPAPAGGSIAVWNCAILGAPEVTIPAEAVAAIAATDPTRLELRFFRFTLDQKANADGNNGTNILRGHGIVGFSTPE
jgi:hypothetical protein